jgi:putative membrane protein insertion efficiency factor
MRVSWTSRIVVALVHTYQLLLSPFLGGACRFEPSCSNYAVTAIEQHGVIARTGEAAADALEVHRRTQVAALE